MNKIIVSLTSYGVRLKSVQNTIRSIVNGSVKPDKIILWVANDDRNKFNEDAVKSVSTLVDIEYCKDLKSYKKICPSIDKYPEDIIVTADDDLIYWKDWLKELIDMHEKYPTSIIAQRCRRMSLEPYKQWHLIREFYISIRNFLTSGAGTLFPPKSLHKDMTNESLYMKYAPTADDVWINAMARKQGTQIVCLGHPDLKESDGDKGNALASTNYDKNMNDVYISNIKKDLHLLGFEKPTIKDFHVVYSLVSSKNDCYLEQLLLSIYSLKKFNNVKVKVYVDKSTMDSLVDGREILKEMADVIEVPIPSDKHFTPVERSRYIKTNLRNLTDGDMLFIDTDTCIVDNIDMLNELQGNIYMCPENGQTKLASCIYNTLERKLNCKHHRLYHNSGIIYCKDNQQTRDFYNKWYNMWLYTKKLLNSHRDQEPLAKVNDEMDFIQPLDKSYNKMIYFSHTIDGGRIIHYFATNHQFGQNEFQMIRKNNYVVTDDIFKQMERDFYDFGSKKGNSLCTSDKHSVGLAFYLY